MQSNQPQRKLPRGLFAVLATAAFLALATYGPAAVAECTGGPCSVMGTRLEAERYAVGVNCLDSPGAHRVHDTTASNAQGAVMTNDECELNFGRLIVGDSGSVETIRLRTPGVAAGCEMEFELRVNGVYIHARGFVTTDGTGDWREESFQYPGNILPGEYAISLRVYWAPPCSPASDVTVDYLDFIPYDP